MADNMDPFIDKLLTTFPEFFNLTDSSPGQASTSPSGASAAQSKSSKLEHEQSQNPEIVIALDGGVNASDNGGDNVGESGWAIPDEFAKAEVLKGTWEGVRTSVMAHRLRFLTSPCLTMALTLDQAP